MSLNTLWFILEMVLFIGYFFLEGFDYGVGILLPFVGKNDLERRMVLNSIGPVWDGNEVWLLTAGGAMFAAFPNWYATLFSGFYLALFLMLIGLILRGLALEYRSKNPSSRWRNTWDWLIFIGSLIPALLWGVAFANVVRGVPINAQMNFTGNFFTLLNPYALLGGIAFLLVFMLHGSLFLSLKTSGDVEARAKKFAMQMGIPVAIVLLLFVIFSYVPSAVFKYSVSSALVFVIFVLAFIAVFSVRFLVARHGGWAFTMMGLTIALTTLGMFLGIYPNVMISSTNPKWNLTIFNAASNQHSLFVMTIVALILVPIVLAYQIWTYYIFRKRIKITDHMDY